MFQATQNVPLDQLLVDDQFCDVAKLVSMVTPHMHNIADAKGWELGSFGAKERVIWCWIYNQNHAQGIIL